MRCYTGMEAELRQKMYGEIGDHLRAGGRACMLVPEQYTLEAELEAMEALELSGSFDLQVLSPARLFSRAFEAAGQPGRTRVDERGRVTLLCALMGDLDLTRYQNAQKKPGFGERMAQEIARCKQAGLTPDALLLSARDMGPCAIADKLADTAKVWRVYEDALQGRFLDGEDERQAALSRLPQLDFLHGARVWARGFELVSPALADTLFALDATVDSVTLLIPCSAGRDADCWSPVQDSLSRLNRRFEGRIHFEALKAEERSGETAFLAREMSAYPARTRPGAPESVSVAALKTPEDEARYAVGLIRELVRQNNWRYRDCAILCENLPTYVDKLHRAAKLYDVPLFAEEQRPAVSHSAARYLLFALRMIARGYPAGEARLLLRTGCTDLTDEECDILSNYIYEFGIRGSLWKRPFARGGEKRTAEAEPLRERFIAPLLAAEARVKAAKTVRDQLSALWQLAEDVQLAKKLRREADDLFAGGHMVEAAESAQIWNRIVGEFDQLEELLGQRQMPLAQLTRLLEAGLSASSVSPLPQSNDAVCAASVSRVRSRPFRAIVIIGAADSSPIREDGLLDSAERARLEEVSGAWFPPDGDGRLRLRALDYKNAVSLARNRLAVTYPLGVSGDRSAFGYPVRWIHRIFPDLKEETPERVLRVMYASPQAACVLAGAARNGSELSGERAIALSALRESAPLCPPPAPHKEETTLPAQRARKLYGGPMSVHVTRLETFAACPFRHFVQYGLRPYQIRPFEYELKDRGELVHQAMDRFFRESPASETTEQATLRAEKIARELAETETGQRIHDDPLSRALTEGLVRRARAAADAAVFQLEGSRFRVISTETSFGEKNPLVYARSEDVSVPLSGRIDRMDLWESQRRYVRVVDYKSSRSHTLDYVRLYYRLQLQLPIYLAAAAELYHADPAGAYYLPAVAYIPQTDQTDPAAIALCRREKLALSGITASDPEIIEASSPHPQAALGLRMKKDGTPGKSNALMTQAQLAALSRFALDQAGQLLTRIRRGEADVSPVRCGAQSSCEYCEFSAACQIDKPARRLPPLAQKEALQRILPTFDLKDE